MGVTSARPRPERGHVQVDSVSIGSGEDRGSSRLAGDEVFALLALKGEEPNSGLRLLFYLLLRLLRAVPRGDDEAALLGDDLPELLVALGTPGVLLAEGLGL